jgi:hypothetical protein
MFKIYLIILLLLPKIFSFKTLIIKKPSLKLYMNPHDMVNYLTSMRNYTIITVGNKNKKIENYMLSKNMDVYYVNLDNILNKTDILDFLQNKYKNNFSIENVWIFKNGFYIGSTDTLT